DAPDEDVRQIPGDGAAINYVAGKHTANHRNPGRSVACRYRRRAGRPGYRGCPLGLTDYEHRPGVYDVALNGIGQGLANRARIVDGSAEYAADERDARGMIADLDRGQTRRPPGGGSPLRTPA